MDSLHSLYLRNFRNYKEEEIVFSPKVNLLQGANGQGKTNLFEAIYLLTTGKSFRTRNLKDLILKGASHFYLEGRIIKHGVTHTLSLSYDGTVKHLRYNHTSFSSFTPLLGLLPTVLITPEDIEIIQGGPQARRDFLDLHLAAINPLYVHHIKRYSKALKHRNTLLKAQKKEGLEAWETMLLLSGSYLQDKRREQIEEFNQSVGKKMESLSLGKESLELHYLPSFASQEEFARLREKEFLLGVTLKGPHRDDISLVVNGEDARLFASQGQKRSIVTALKMAAWDQFFKLNETPPVLGIDDFSVHLDQNRTTRVLEEIVGFGQVFLTSPISFTQGIDLNLEIKDGTILEPISSISSLS